MNKVIELANKAGFHTKGVIVRTIHSNGSWVSVNGELERFYTLARADLEAEIFRLREHIIDQTKLEQEIAQLRKERQAFKDVTEYQASEIVKQKAALNAMLTQFGMDEDEWSKPTFNQARAALEKPND